MGEIICVLSELHIAIGADEILSMTQRKFETQAKPTFSK